MMNVQLELGGGKKSLSSVIINGHEMNLPSASAAVKPQKILGTKSTEWGT